MTNGLRKRSRGGLEFGRIGVPGRTAWTTRNRPTKFGTYGQRREVSSVWKRSSRGFQVVRHRRSGQTARTARVAEED